MHLTRKSAPFCSITVCAILLAGCNSEPEMGGPERAVAEAPAPVLTPGAAATVAPDGTALVPGSWSINEDAMGVRAQYAAVGEQPAVTVTCDPTYDAVTLSVAATAGGPQAWRLDAGGEAARIDMLPSGGVLPELTAQVNQGLAIIQSLADQGGVFMLTSPQGQPSQFPTHPGIRRVLDRCNPMAAAPVAQETPDAVIAPSEAPIR
ncbi:hypothetical protein [Aurantiacibacter sp. MUD61]|uniref:hypothetical protein n=1 Tax=Aurantiacibacter sp. MUD61 TaxID=3009083 RepID=UPI0022F0B88A|nr:hypothetical protein [Aurantiacibacter sp. MUD61]